ncbi:VanW family protein [Desulfosporosinus sp. SB140]|uniref:VanW family protein n=1 Tax=Desulfosporosinus paludis TaxID=3115649 RepID=UPI0038908B11
MEENAGTDILPLLNLLKRHKILLMISILTLLLGAFTLILYTWDRGQIAEGVVLEIPLGQLSIQEAQSKLEQLKHEISKRPVHFISDKKSFPISMEELGLTYNYQEPLQQAYLIGREGNFFNKAISKFRASWGITFRPNCQWSDQVLKATLTKHLADLNIPAEDAHFLINPDKTMQIVPEKIGKQVDFDSLIASVKKQSPNHVNPIPIPFQTVKPAITKIDLQNVKENGLLSNYTTSFDPNLKERTLNIKLAAKAIDGMLLKPGEVFSFNETVGPRTAEAGYQEAMIIEGSTFVPGLGGGICQVSSTLYNAVRLASPSLSVVERTRHSLPVTYVPPGQDATVAYPNLDFKFRNDSGSYLLIRSYVNYNTLNLSIYGKAKTQT